MYILISFSLLFSIITTSCPNFYYYNVTSNLCQNCGIKCKTCSNSTYCLACKQGSYLSQNACLSCNSTCRTCSQQNACQTCALGAYRQEITLACVLCTQYCDNCVNNESCYRCQYGYYKDNSKCKICNNQCICNGFLQTCGQNQQGLSKLAKIGIIIACILLPIALVVFVFYKCKCFSKQVNYDNQNVNNITATSINFSIFTQGFDIGSNNLAIQRQWKVLQNSQVVSQHQICSICLNTKVDVLTLCGHSYHFLCLLNWKIRKSQCPMCKRELNSRMKKLCIGCNMNYCMLDIKNLNFDYKRVIQKCRKCKRQKISFQQIIFTQK